MSNLTDPHDASMEAYEERHERRRFPLASGLLVLWIIFICLIGGYVGFKIANHSVNPGIPHPQSFFYSSERSHWEAVRRSQLQAESRILRQMYYKKHSGSKKPQVYGLPK